MNRIFGRKKKEGKDGIVEGGKDSENEFLSSLPAKANKRYSMAYSSYQPGDGNNSIGSSSGRKIDNFDDKGKAVDTPEFFVNTINVLPNIEILAQLCSSLQSKPSSWSKSLIDCNGIEALLNVLSFIDKNGQKDSDIILQSLTVTCLLSLLNSKYGIEKAIITPNSMIKLITSMDTPKLDTRSSVFEILTAICMISEKGYQLILEAMTHFKHVRQEKFRFTFLVDSMKKLSSSRDFEYLTTCLTLINGIVNSSEEIDERIQLRTEFTRLGLDEIIRVNKKIQYEEAPDLLTQIDVYEDELRADQEELSERFTDLDIDINDANDVFKIIYEQSKDKLHHPLLPILQSLLSISSDSDVGMLSWFLIEKLVQQISVNKPMIGNEDGKVNLEDLLASTAPSVALQSEFQKNIEELAKVKDQLKKALFDLNIATQELSSRSHESSVLKSNMFNTVKQKDQEIIKLRGQMKRIDSNFFSPPTGDVDNNNSNNNNNNNTDEESHHQQSPRKTQTTASSKPPLLPKSSSGSKPPVAKSKSNLSSNSSDSLNDDIKSQVIAAQQKEKEIILEPTPEPIISTPAPAPIIASAPPPPPPMMGGGPPPPPPPPMMGGGPPPPPPPMGGKGGPPPPPGGGLFNSNKPPANAPKFTVSKPTTKVKQFQWTKIPNKKLGDTIFTNLGTIKTDWLNVNEIENLFFAPEAASSKKLEASDKKSTSSTKPGTVSVIDPKKSQNLAIYLSKFKCPLNEIKTALYTLDEDVFSMESLKSLEQYLPTEEDMEAIRDYLKKDGELKMLTKAEHFLLEMDSVSNLAERVKSFYLKIQFPDKLKEIKPDLELFIKTVKDIKNSKNFLKVMEVVLIIGNFLNGGTARGDCFGFKLDALLKLSDTKTANNKSNLLVYIISELEQKFPDSLKFMDDLSGVQECVKISMNTISADLNLLKKDLDIVNNGIGKMKRTKDESYFFQTMDDFIKDATIEIKIAFEQFHDAEKNFQQLAILFGEESKIPSEEFFSMVNRFIVMFDKFYKDFQRDKEAAERAIKREEAKAKKAQQMKRMANKLSASNKNTSGGSTTSLNGSQENQVVDIMESVKSGDAFKQRRQRKVANENTSEQVDNTCTSTSVTVTTPSGIELDLPSKGTRREKKSSSSKEKEKEKEKEEPEDATKKDINVAAKALTIVMRSKQSMHTRIDAFNFDA